MVTSSYALFLLVYHTWAVFCWYFYNGFDFIHCAFPSPKYTWDVCLTTLCPSSLTGGQETSFSFFRLCLPLKEKNCANPHLSVACLNTNHAFSKESHARLLGPLSRQPSRLLVFSRSYSVVTTSVHGPILFFVTSLLKEWIVSLFGPTVHSVVCDFLT